MEATRSTDAVNSVKNDTEECIAPLSDFSTGQGESEPPAATGYDTSHQASRAFGGGDVSQALNALTSRPGAPNARNGTSRVAFVRHLKILEENVMKLAAFAALLGTGGAFAGGETEGGPPSGRARPRAQ